MAESPRRTAAEIFEVVIRSAREELERSTSALLFSGFAGGSCVGLTGLGVSLFAIKIICDHIPNLRAIGAWMGSD
jgi:hypothetical protein